LIGKKEKGLATVKQTSPKRKSELKHPLEPKKKELDSQIEQFLDYLKYEKNASPHTISAYKLDLSEFNKYLKENEIKTVNHQVIRGFLVCLDQKKNSKSTMGRKLSSIKAFYKFLVKIGDYKDSPALYVSRPKAPKYLPLFFTEEEIKRLTQDLENGLKKAKKANKLRNEIEFCSKSHEIIKETKEVIMLKTREKIEEETQRLFLDLVWKSKTFKEINILENYDLELIHAMGYDCLGSISAAERALLALSFTLALHEISGFDSPFLIDTPVARVTDENRENLGKIFAKVGETKQIILLFTPNEYSKEISKILDMKCSSRRTCELSAGEMESSIKEL